MIRSLPAVGMLTIVSLVAGCGRREPELSPDQQMNAIMEANSPFGNTEIQMDEAMDEAVGTSVGDSWVRKLIEHHRGGIAIARQTLTMKPDAHIAAMAQATIDEETREVAKLRKLLSPGPPVQATAEIYQPAIDKMHQAMMAANGIGLAETFHRKMLAYHNGAVAMSEVALEAGVTGAVRDKVGQIKASQAKEARTVTDMLAGKA